MRPSNATCGRDARPQQQDAIESTAPISTPRRRPEPSTPSSAATATTNSARCERHRRASASTLNEAGDRDSTIAASTGCGRSRSRPERNRHDHEHDQRRDQARERRARAAALVDERLRHAAADRKAAPEAGGEVRGGEREELLVRVDAVAVLLRANMRPMAAVSTAPSRKHAIASGSSVVRRRCQLHGRQPEARQALRHLAEQLDAAVREVEHRAPRRCRRSTTNSATGRFGSSDLPSEQHARARRAPSASATGCVSPRCERKWPHALPEVAVRALEAEQLRQLRAREVQRDAGLEADHARSRR